ncbi:MAG: nuclear transport factor 2 family protein [Pseudomonadota bacterium]
MTNTAHTESESGALAGAWIEAWNAMDLDWLRAILTEGFVHDSPFGKLEGRDHYLDTVAPIASGHVHKLAIQNIVSEGDQAVVWFDNHTPQGVVPACDWITITEGQIASVHSFYDSTLIREVLTARDLRQLRGS